MDTTSTTEGLTAVESLAMDPRVNASVEAFYASSLQLVRLVKSDARGRHFVARRDLQAGYEVWSGEPYAAITDAQRSRTHCAHCLQAPTQTLLRCSRCKMLRYCTAECQVQPSTLSTRIDRKTYINHLLLSFIYCVR
jgi:hypothetical protein